MTKDITCIVCPNGCTLHIDYEQSADHKIQVKAVTGYTCKRGLEYANQEMTDPKRTIASSVLVEGGEAPLVSVRTNGPIPKAKIFAVMAEIQKTTLQAPVKAGTVVLADVLGLGVDVIATKTVDGKILHK